MKRFIITIAFSYLAAVAGAPSASLSAEFTDLTNCENSTKGIHRIIGSTGHRGQLYTVRKPARNNRQSPGRGSDSRREGGSESKSSTSGSGRS